LEAVRWRSTRLHDASIKHINTRPSSIDASSVRQLKFKGLGATAVAKELGIGRASVYRAQEDA